MPAAREESPRTPTAMPVDSTDERRDLDLKFLKEGLVSVKQEIADKFESVERDVSIIKNSLNDAIQAMKNEARNQNERSNQISEEFEKAKVAQEKSLHELTQLAAAAAETREQTTAFMTFTGEEVAKNLKKRDEQIDEKITQMFERFQMKKK